MPTHFHAFRDIKGQRGFSLLEAMMALAVLGAITIGIVSTMKHAKEAQDLTAKAGQIEELRYFIRHNVDCAAAVSVNPTCNPSEFVPLKDTLGTAISDGANSSVILAGDMRVRGYCQTEGVKSLRVEYQQGKDATWRDLFDGLPLTCCGGFDNVTKDLDMTEIKNIVASRLGVVFGPKDHIYGEIAHAAEICLLAGFNVSSSFSLSAIPAADCANHRVGMFRDGGKSMQFRDACYPSKRALASVRCMERRPVGCEDRCPETYRFTETLHVADFVSSHYPNEVRLAYAGSSQSLRGWNYETLMYPYVTVSGNRSQNFGKICNLRGYAQAGTWTSKGYSSPSDNIAIYWNAATGRWVEANAAAEGNRNINTLNCSKPLPTCRIGP